MTRSTAQRRLIAVGRASIRALAAPRRVARRAYGRPRWCSALSVSPIAATCPDGRRPTHDHLADGVGDLAGVPARVFLEDARKAPLVDQVERATVLAERRRKSVGRRGAGRPGRVVAGRAEQDAPHRPD
jgi:hypothetical protein